MATAVKNTAIMREDIQLYLNQVKQGLADLPDKQKQVVSDLKESILDYLEDHNDAPLEELYLHFGRPEAIIRDNIGEVPETEVVKSKRLKNWVIGGIIAFLALVTLYYVFCFVDGWMANRGQGVVTIAQTAQINTILNSIGGSLI